MQVQYRRGQQMRHKSKSQSTGKGIAGRDAQFADNKLTDALFKAPERHLTHFSKVLYSPFFWYYLKF